MKLEFHGHDERYIVEQSMMNLFPLEKPVYGAVEPGETEQETDDRVDRFSEEFNRAVSDAVRKKTPGYSPMEGEREIRDDFLRGFYRRGN